MITPSVIMDPEDEDIMVRFESAGVKIDIRAVPASTPGTFVPRNRTGV